MKIKKVLLLLGLLLVLSLPIVVLASDGVFSLAEGEEYNANSYWTGEKMIINGQVNGDIYVAASEIEINGSVKGDLIFLTSNEVVINGVVDGNVRGLTSEKFTLNGEIKRSLSAVASNVYINDDAKIGATSLLAASNVEMRGDISGNLDGFIDSLFISGKLTHSNVRVNKLVVGEAN